MRTLQLVTQGNWRVALPLLCGIVLGPQGLGILNPTILGLIDPAVPVALAALGILVIFELRPSMGDRPALAVAAGHALLAAGVVAGVTAVLIPRLLDLPPGRSWTLAALLGVCASCSSALGTNRARVRTVASRIVDLDAILLIGAGAVAIAIVHAPSLPAIGSHLFQAVGVTLLVTGAGWLLLGRTESEIERRVFGLAVLLLLGGAADYLSMSALLGGSIAGAVWQAAGGTAREAIRQDLSSLQHLIQLVVLVVAGARTEFSVAVAAIAIAYVFMRAIGKLAAGLAIAAATGTRATRNLASRLVSPGMLAVAFAVDAARAIGPDIIVVVSIVVLGTIALQLVAGNADAEDTA